MGSHKSTLGLTGEIAARALPSTLIAHLYAFF